MSFESRIVAWSSRFLSSRAFEMIVVPALADLQFEQATGRATAARGRLAVARAAIGALGADIRRGSLDFLSLTVMPVCYYLALIIICFDFFSLPVPIPHVLTATAVLLLVFACGPVMVCFWPERQSAD